MGFFGKDKEEFFNELVEYTTENFDKEGFDEFVKALRKAWDGHTQASEIKTKEEKEDEKDRVENADIDATEAILTEELAKEDQNGRD